MTSLITQPFSGGQAPDNQSTTNQTWFAQYQLRGSILVIKDNASSVSGFISFGTDMTTIPTSATSGTGVYIDYSGIYGLSGGTQNFKLDAAGGSITAISGTIGGWTISSVDLHNAASTVMLRGAGNLAFGATPPTSATVGTGIFIDSTGIYGLAANVQQFYLQASNGVALAGAGAVTLDVNGIRLLAGTSTENFINWTSAAFPLQSVGFVNNQVFPATTTRKTTIGSQARAANSDVDAWFAAQASLDSGAGAQFHLYARNSDSERWAKLVTTLGLTIGGSVGAGVDTPPSALLHLFSTAPTTLWEDTTSSAKDLLLTVDANLAKFTEYGGAAPNLLVLDLANARVGIGTAAPANPFHVKTSASTTLTTVEYNGASGSGIASPVISFITDDGAAMASSDRIGEFWFGGATDASHTTYVGASFTFRASEAWSSTAGGASMEFYVTPNTTHTPAKALTIQNDSTFDFAGNIRMGSGINIITNTGTGTKFGTATNQKIGFFGATAIVQGTAFTQTYSTASHTITQGTMTDPAAFGAGANGYSTSAMAQAIHAEVIALKANMVTTQNVLNGVIDDLQALGLFG